MRSFDDHTTRKKTRKKNVSTLDKKIIETSALFAEQSAILVSL